MAKRQGEEFWCRHLEGWRQSGQTQMAYCAQHGLNIKTFNRWRGKERRTGGSSPLQQTAAKLTLVPVCIQETASSTPGVIRLYSPQGWRIELAGAALGELAALLRELP